jgi:preprotein translocase subunit SecE
MTPFRILVAFVVLSILGFAAVPLLSVDLNPREREPILTVSFSIPHSSPEIVEKLATSALEGAFSQVTELKKITWPTFPKFVDHAVRTIIFLIILAGVILVFNILITNLLVGRIL